MVIPSALLLLITQVIKMKGLMVGRLTVIQDFSSRQRELILMAQWWQALNNGFKGKDYQQGM